MTIKAVRLLSPVIIALFLWVGAAGSSCAQGENMLERQFDNLELEIFDRYWYELEQEIGNYLPDFHWREVLSWFQGDEGRGISVTALISGFLRFLFREILLNIRLLGQLLMLAVAAALLKNLHSAFESSQVEQIAQAVVFIVLMGIAIQSFNVAAGIGREAIGRLVDFMLGLIPVLLVLLASLGSFSSAAIFHPLLILSINLFSTIIGEVLFPLIFFTTVLTLVSYFTPHYKLNRLADFLKNISIWGLGTLLTIFVGITAIQGVAGTVTDAVGLRTAKYMTGTFLPVVGKMLADAVETVAGVSLLLKNCVNLTGLIILLLITAFPLLKLLSLTIIYKLAAALIQPLGDTPLADCLDAMGSCLALIFGAVAAVSLLFFISITIIMGAGNALLMLR